MSRIGKKPLAIPSGVKIDVKDRVISVSGPKGNLNFSHPEGVSVAIDGAELRVERASDVREHRAFHGLTRALVSNMIVGVTQGYTQKMEVYGTGYGCTVSGNSLDLTVGYSHQVKLPIPQGIKVTVDVAQAKGDETPARLTIEGIDKQLVGQFARNVKDARKPEPYKGKGVRYEGEQIRRKAGKAFAGAGG
ncbi:MAG TPA: 50S ribosomal protein L6 [Phycisphaerae bacterium]|nr:50S ribosomal protein L6 [Phycisphaerae bacterium]HRW53272.1 50S ribosomal protein L6 [Phycisphaerae bacterium]